MNKKGLALAVILILVTSVFVYPVQYADATDNMMIKEECTSEGWSVIIADPEGNPLPNVRLLTVDGMRSSGYEESFFTDDKGMVLIPFSSITGFVKILKGGYVDQTLSIFCNPPAGYAGNMGTNLLRYTDPIYGIQIDYPPDWQKDTSDPNFRVVLISPQESTRDWYAESVSIVVQNVEFKNAADYTSSTISLIKSSIPSLELVENVKTILGGHPAQKITLTYVSQGIESKEIAYFVIVDGIGYTIIFDAESTKYQRYMPIFEQMIDSIEIGSTTSSEKTITPLMNPSLLQYENLTHGIKIEYPSSWITSEFDEPTPTIVFTAPFDNLQDAYQETFGIVILDSSPDKADSSQFAEVVMDGYSQQFSNFNLVESSEIILSGHPAVKKIYTGTNAGFDLKGVNIFLAIDTKIYMIQFTSDSEKRLSEYLPIIQEMIDSIEIGSIGVSEIQGDVSAPTPIMPQMISGKYINSEAGMEIEFPEKLAGFEITFPKDIDYSELPAELQGMAEIYSGMTMVMMLPAELDPTENVEMIMLTIMETSSIETFSEFISQTVEGAASQSSGDISDTESQPECDISNQTILEINEMKTTLINSECYDPTENMTVTMPIYMFVTPEYIVSTMYMVTHEPEQTSDLSIFEDSLNTLKIENTIDISDPYSYAELFGLKVTQEKIMVENKSHEIEIVSDSSITNFSFDENNKEISFKLQEDKDATLGSTEIYLGNVLKAPYTVTIDGNVDDAFMVTEDKTTGQTSINVSYLHPVDTIIIKANKANALSDAPIPAWIKNNAKWWVEGTIDDKAFVSGIQFLIKEGLIQIPETTTSTTAGTSQEIPTWIKNNADWWSQGLISDDDFLKGITFMVENGIITV